MWDEFYIWIERYTGVTYNLSEEFSNVTKYMIFVNPYEWKSRIMAIVDHIGDVIDTIDQYGDDIPDYLPDKEAMKKTFTEDAVQQLLFIVNQAKHMINVEEVDITSYDIMMNQIQVLSDLVNMCLEEFPVKPTTFDTYEDENDDAMNTYLGIIKSDMTNIGMTINEIRNEYFAMLEEDDDEQ